MIKISAEFKTYWQISTGRGAGHYMDSIIDKDQDGLPYVSGKTLKGLFRSAVEKLEHWQTEQNQQTQQLFGTTTGQNRSETTAGELLFTSLKLTEQEINSLNESPELKRMLTTSVSSTKIDTETGVASNKSLRTQEVALPLKLTGNISLTDNSKTSLEDIIQILSEAAPFITNIGSKKSRGYGQVTITITSEKGQK